MARLAMFVVISGNVSDNHLEYFGGGNRSKDARVSGAKLTVLKDSISHKTKQMI